MAVAADDHSFTPSNESLVDRYLRPKIAGGQINDHANACFFNDADVCSARPYDLPCALQVVDDEAVANHRRNQRQGVLALGGQPVAVEGSAGGGFMQKFSYHVRPAPGVIEKLGWIMAEYTVNKDTTRAGDLVLCKVYRSPRGPGRSRASSSSSASAAATNSGCKRKATDDEEHLEAATPCTRPRLTEEDDVMLLAEDIERGLLSHDDHTAAPEFEETTQHVEESEPEPQLVDETVDGKMSFEEIKAAIMMGDEEDEKLRVPDGEDPVAFYMRFLGLSDVHQQPQEQEASFI
ncbi:hypothetical protein EJB05_11193, partial [Eragrostis curvula]